MNKCCVGWIVVAAIMGALLMGGLIGAAVVGDYKHRACTRLLADEGIPAPAARDIKTLCEPWLPEEKR